MTSNWQKFFSNQNAEGFGVFDKNAFSIFNEPDSQEEGLALHPLTLGSRIRQTDDLIPGLVFENQWGTAGKVTSLLPDGGFRYRQYDNRALKWGPVENISREDADQYFKEQLFTVSEDPTNKIPEGARAKHWADIEPGDNVWVQGEQQKVVGIEDAGDSLVYRLENGNLVHHSQLDRPVAGTDQVYHKPQSLRENVDISVAEPPEDSLVEMPLESPDSSLVQVPLEQIAPYDNVHTKKYGPQKVVEISDNKVRLDNGVVLPLIALVRVGDEYLVSTAPKPVEPPLKFQHIEAPKNWHRRSYLLQDADQFLGDYKKLLTQRARDIVKAMGAGHLYWHRNDGIWQDMSDSEKRLAGSSTIAAKEFLKLLTPEEREAWETALEDWRSGDNNPRKHRLLGALEKMGVEGNIKPFENEQERLYREEGSNDYNLHHALSKAIAFSQMIYGLLGLDQLTLYRIANKNMPPTVKPGQKVKTITASELSPFTIDPKVAYKALKDGKVVVRYRVPISRLFISPITYAPLGMTKKPYRENEFPVAGLNGLEGHLMPDAMDQYGIIMFKKAHAQRPLFGPVFDEDTIALDMDPEGWLHGPHKEDWWSSYCHWYDHWCEENEPRGCAKLATVILASETRNFRRWFNKRYNGGKKRVPNPNPKTRERFPDIAVSTAMKYPEFAKEVYEAYRRETKPEVPDVVEPEVTKPLDIDEGGFKKVGPQAGSNPGGLYEAPDGTRYYVKIPKNEDRARNEILAGKLYELAGIDVPQLQPAKLKGKDAVASKIIPGLREDPHALRSGKVPGVAEGMATDAWLANWDVVGLDYDNLLVNKEGKAQRVDTGGALRYRAMGSPKGGAFGDKITEFDVFMDPYSKSGSVFSKLSPEQIVASIDRVLAIPEDKIRKVVEEWGPKDSKEKTKLLKTLLARRKDLAKHKKEFEKKAGTKMASDRTRVHGILRLAKRNPQFKEELLGALRRLIAPRDFASEQQAQQVMLTNLRSGDLLKVTVYTGEDEPDRDVRCLVAFDYDPAERSVEVTLPDGKHGLLQDRGQNEGVVYSGDTGKALPVRKISIIRSEIETSN